MITIEDEEIKFLGNLPTGEKVTSNAWNVKQGTFGKHYFPRFGKTNLYVQLPKSKLKVFLRTAVFIRIQGTENDPLAPFVVVHEWGKKGDIAHWEPTKGQVEPDVPNFRQGMSVTPQKLSGILRHGAYREVCEEAKITPNEIISLKIIPNLIYGGSYPDYPPDFRFQYHIFEAVISRKTFEESQERIRQLKNHTDLNEILPKCEKEKDGVELWNPRKPRWDYLMAPHPRNIVRQYVAYKASKQA
jgi:8-oxo-dGTP pyrophosphatase MutT (NUDIX family)